MKKSFLLVVICFFILNVLFAQKPAKVVKNTPAKKHGTVLNNERPVLPGAYQTDEYMPLLRGKRVGIFANNTATLGKTHLADTLQKLGINITKIFGPEHGFRGNADAGEKVDTYTDSQTGIPVVSLYGKKIKPSAQDLAEVDILLFDIQDVGVRFYTYISSLQAFMESALENKKPLIILDRPDPNGFYVDGPVLDTAFKSFVGMQPVPVVYGMTIGEYAKFLIGENLLRRDAATSRSTGEAAYSSKNEKGLKMIVIKCKNYTHNSKYILPEKPSPNLPDAGSVYWYPSTCFFEGTVLSEGRGTDKPFEIFGHPSLPKNLYTFTPVANAGSSDPKLKNQLCYGWNLSASNEQIVQKINNHIQIKYLLEAYKLFPDKENFFIKPKQANAKLSDYHFNRLAGNAELMQQIIDGKTETEIRKSWEPKLAAFKKIRKKYLLYPDFSGSSIR